jgi:hypothetical protein
VTINTLPLQNPDSQQQVLLISTTINEVLKGRANNTGTLTLEDGVTTTVVEDNLFQSDMVPLLMPTTANAAGALATTYVSARANGSFTLTHANAGTTDRTFLYARWG